MKPDLEFSSITYDIIGAFIEKAAEQGRADSLFMLGKVAGYVDRARSLDLISELEAKELLTCIELYRRV